jgi:hypothetical protein
LFRGIHKSPIKEFWRIRASENSQSLDFNHFMVEIGATFLQALNLFI